MFKFRPDWLLILPVIFLILISLTILSSVAPQLLVTQVFFLITATVLFLFFSQLDYEVIFSLHFVIYIISLVFALLPVFFGIFSRGAQRWLQIGQFTLQPSELIKPFLLVTFASIAVSNLSYKKAWLLAVGMLPMLIIYFQPDLGTTLVIFVGWTSVLLSRFSAKTAVALISAIALIALPVYKFGLHDYQRQRLITFVNPYQDPLGTGYHVIQSTIAIGSGQLIGRGLGQGTQTQLKFLPEHHTDFIFASISEELGFIGGLMVIVLYGYLYWRIYKISQNTTDPKASLFCLSAVALLSFQTFINIGMNLGLTPITGITLPFLSYGGSSLWSLAITLGLVNSIAARQRVSDGLLIT
jgi:rod shape determining protein RodA